MSQINGYIGFNGQCRGAMEFYKECFGGLLEMQPIGESPIAEHFPEEMRSQILHSALTNGELILFGTDMTGPGGYSKGNNIALSVTCRSEEEINAYYVKLSTGGTILDPLKVSFWGALFGMVADKYDIRWMLLYDKNANAANNT